MHSMLNQFFSMIYFFPLRNRSSACSCTICSQTGRFGWTTHPSSSQSKIGRQVVLPVKKLVFCAKELYSPFMFSIHKKESNPQSPLPSFVFFKKKKRDENPFLLCLTKSSDI